MRSGTVVVDVVGFGPLENSLCGQLDTLARAKREPDSAAALVLSK
jgi:hypothetical protein